ncbi:nucleoprotein TPR-like isoform X2 [Ornithodoros turicata]|uniref:nucleoprotein TPR-like isoform X2 n=1 Tax=Ornithodoros turicata TaxID=34597 RepID=UPI00313A4AD5
MSSLPNLSALELRILERTRQLGFCSYDSTPEMQQNTMPSEESSEESEATSTEDELPPSPSPDGVGNRFCRLCGSSSQDQSRDWPRAGQIKLRCAGMAATMAGVRLLDQILAAEETASFSDTVKRKLEDHLAITSKVADALRDENAELSARCNQLVFELETVGSEGQQKLSASEQNCEQLKLQVADLQDKLRICQNDLQISKSSLATKSCDLDIMKKNLDQLSSERAELLASLEKRQKEIDKLNEDVTRLSDELVSNQQKHHEVVVALEEIRVREMTLEHNESRLSQEKTLLQKQVADLMEDLHERVQEVANLRREKTVISCDLRTELDSHKEMVRVLETQLESWKTSAMDKEQRAESLAQRLKEAKESHANLEEHFQKELRAQTKLTQLYKHSDENSKARVQELVTAVEEMQGLLMEAQASGKELENTLNESQGQAQLVISEKEAEIGKLKESLESLSKMIQERTFSTDELERMFPTAAATSRKLKSGPSLTELMHEHYQQREELVKVKGERDSLKLHLDEVAQEVTRKAPIYCRLKEEYQNALESMACMREQQTGLLVDMETLVRERDDARRVLSHAERDAKRWKQQCDDLALQVRHLLREVEDARQRYAPRPAPVEDVSSSDDAPLRASDLITQRLVSFRDIDELQQRNMDLLAVVRDLSEKQEEEEKDTNEERNREMRTKLEAAMSQLQTLEDERRHQATIVAALAKQRDTYKAILTQKNIDVPQMASNGTQMFEPPVTSTPAVPRLMIASPAEKSVLEQSAAEARKKLHELQQEFDSYKKEMQENNKLLSEQLETHRNEASQLRVRAARLQAELDFSQERQALTQTNLESFRKEAATFREHNVQLSNSVVQHQQTLTTIRQELQTAQERLSQAEASLEGARAERDLLRSRENRLLQEQEAMRREKASSERILANLQMVQTNLERLDSETRSTAQSKLQKLELQCESLNSQLRAQVDQQKALTATWEKQLADEKARTEQAIQQAQKTNDDLVEAYAQLHETRQQILALESKTQGRAEGQGSGDVLSINCLLKKTQDQLKETQERLALTQSNMESYKKMLEDVEGRLSEQGASNEDYKQTMERALQEAAEARASLESKVAELEAERNDLIKASVEEAKVHRQQLEEEHQKLEKALAELEEARQQRDDECRRDNTLLQDHSFQAALTKEAQEKYERELILHAADVEALSATKALLEETQTKVAALQEAANAAQALLQESCSSWKEREKLLLSEKELLAMTEQELRNQNTALHEQLETLSAQLSAVKSQSWEDITPEEHNKSTEQLMEVVRYLRKEKEMVLKQAEASTAESSRLRVQVDHQAKVLQQMEQDLKEEREKAVAKATSDAQHTELLRKVEMVNILSESNRVLRDEKEKLGGQKKQLEEKVAQLEKAEAPLRDELRSLKSQLEAVQGDNSLLKNELQRWQARTSQLLEQSARMDPEDFKRVAQENTSLKQQVQALNDELQASKSQIQKAEEESAELRNRLNSAVEDAKKLRGEFAAIPQLRKELLAARSEAERQKQELMKLSTEIEKLKEDKEEKLKTIIQVKKIARKYRSQYEETKSEKDALDARLTELQSKQDTADEASTHAKSESESKMLELEQKSVELTESYEKAKADLALVTQEKEQVTSAAAESQEKARKLLTQARKRIADLMAKADALTKSNQELKGQVQKAQGQLQALEQAKDEVALRENTIKSQFEGRLQRQERELRDSKEALEVAHRQVEELSQKLAQHQHQHQKPPKPTMVAAPVERSSGNAAEPVTANVRPLTPPVAPVAAAPSALRQASGPSAARLTPTASIRPMAQTRLVAVVPTSVPASIAGESSATPVPVASVQPDIQAAPNTVIVTPSSVQEATVPVAVETATASDVMRHAEEEVVAAPVEHVVAVTDESTSAAVSTESTMSLLEEAKHSTERAPSPTLKRSREETAEDASTSEVVRETAEEERLAKKMKLQQKEAELLEEERVIAADEGEEEAKDQAPEVPSGASEAEGHLQGLTSPADVIVVESDEEAIEEEQEKGIEGGDFEREESGMEDEGSACDDEEMNVGYNAGGVGEGEEEMPVEEIPEHDIADEEGIDEECVIAEGDMEDQVDNEVEIIDVVEESVDDREMDEPIDPTTSHGDTQDEGSVPQPCPQISIQRASPTPSQTSPSPLQRPSLLTRSRSERLPSSQSAAGFEEGDDSIVPSTPTLFVPRRSDGFAEAVSSPHVPHGGFVFGSAQESSASQEAPGISQLASQGAVGVDDTRMDLSHFEEGGGQSVPSTPLQISPPESRDASLFQSDAASADLDQPRSSSGNASGQPTSLNEQSVPGPIITETTDETDDGLATVVPLVEEPASESSEVQEEADSQPAKPSTSSDASALPALDVIEEKPEEIDDGISTSVDQQTPGNEQQSTEQPQSQRRRIVWDAPSEMPAASPPAIATPTPAAPVASTTRVAHFSSPTREAGAPQTATRGQRGRRVRLRGASTRGAAASQPASTWTAPGWRGGRGTRPPRGGRGGYIQ